MPEVALTGLSLDYPHSGTATYTRHLAPLLPVVAPDLDYRLVLRDAVWQPDVQRFQRVQTPFRRLNRERATWARLDKLAWETWSFPLAARKADLLHYVYFAAPVVAAQPYVVTVHDLIPLVLPDYHRGRASALYADLMKWTVPRAAHIITVSEHSKRDIVRVLGIPEYRVHVTYEAAGEDFSPTRVAGEEERLRALYGLPERYVLYIGGAEKRKNIETLVRALVLLSRVKRGHDITLLIVARFPPPDALYPDIPGLIRQLGIEARVCLISSIAEEDKPALYRGALALCFPSTYEGFGLTPLEAMACGTPVIASNATSLPEVVGDAGILLAPRDVDVWAEAIQEVVSSPARRTVMREAGLRQAEKFFWEETARQTVAVYRTAMR